jgi:hypothetical protein
MNSMLFDWVLILIHINDYLTIMSIHINFKGLIILNLMKSLSIVTWSHLLIQQRAIIVELVRCIPLILELRFDLVLVRFAFAESLIYFIMIIISNYFLSRLLTFIFSWLNWNISMTIYRNRLLYRSLFCIDTLLKLSFITFGVLLIFIHNSKFAIFIFICY